MPTRCDECPQMIAEGSRSSTCSERCRKAAQRGRRGEPRRRLRGATVDQRAAELLAEAEPVGPHRLARRTTPAGAPKPERVAVEGATRLAPAGSIVYAAEHGGPLLPVRATCGHAGCLTVEHLERLGG